MVVSEGDKFYGVLREIYKNEISISSKLENITQVHFVVSGPQYNGSDSIIFSTAAHTPDGLMKALTAVKEVFGNAVSVVDIIGEGANAKIEGAMVYLEAKSNTLKEALQMSLNTARIATQYNEK